MRVDAVKVFLSFLLSQMFYLKLSKIILKMKSRPVSISTPPVEPSRKDFDGLSSSLMRTV